MRAKRMAAERFCKLFSEVCAEITETGRHYIITKNGKGLVRLEPPDGWEPPQKKRKAGTPKPTSKKGTRKRT